MRVLSPLLKIWSLLLLCFALLFLSGCSGLSWSPTEKFTETNQMIADSNNNRLKYFADGMAACMDNAACQVALSMAFAGNLGQQQFFKPETAKDYLIAAMPYATLGADIFRFWHGGGGGSQGMVVTGSGNNFIGVGNKTSADNGASLTYDTPAYLSYNTTSQNKTTGSGPIDNNGTAPAQVVNPVIVKVPAGTPAE
jgi:hypothetical protein